MNYIIILLFSAILFSNVSFAEEHIITEQQLIDKARGAWLGQIIANYAGRDTEGYYSSSAPNPDPNVPWILKQIWDADDDTDIEYVALHILEANGFDCNSVEITSQWLGHVTLSGIYIANRQAYSLMQDGFLPTQTGSRSCNMHWYAIDSQITTEVLGVICPGLPSQAVNLTRKFAGITNQGFPTHAAQFYAAMYAEAFFESDVNKLIDAALEAVPPTSRTYQVINDVKNWYIQDMADGQPDWRATRQKLYDNYQGTYSHGRYYNWIESTINTGATVMCILYGQGDYKKTVQIGVLAGWDCDCNPATAGGLIGVIGGYSSLPSDLTDPNFCGDIYKNVYRPYLPDPNLYRPQYENITSIANRIATLAGQNIIENGGYITYQPEKTYHIPIEQGPLPRDPNLPDPQGPSGLVAEAIDAGINVSVSASVERYNANYDRNNLYAIIDGIKNNTHNGHKPYWTYVYDPSSRPQKDFYQIEFDTTVRFDQITFYEGDIDWGGINTYCQDDDSDGGYFQDISVQILQDGSYITPANIQQSEPLQRCKMYQEINFSFEPTTGTAIRIIGTPGGTKGFTTIIELETQGSVIVDMQYLAEFAKCWLIAPNDPAMDTNENGIVDIIDFAVLSENWQRGY